MGRDSICWTVSVIVQAVLPPISAYTWFVFFTHMGASSSSSSSSSLSRSPSGPLRRSWRSHIRYLHGVDCTRALASSWTLLSQTLRGRPDGLLQLAIGFLPSYLSTMRRRTSCACTRRATWPNRDKRRWRNVTDKPDRWGGRGQLLHNGRWSVLQS